MPRPDGNMWQNYRAARQWMYLWQQLCYIICTNRANKRMSPEVTHSEIRGCLTEMCDEGNTPRILEYQQTNRHWLLYSINSAQHTALRSHLDLNMLIWMIEIIEKWITVHRQQTRHCKVHEKTVEECGDEAEECIRVNTDILSDTRHGFYAIAAYEYCCRRCVRLRLIFSCGCTRLCSPVESMQLVTHAHCGRQLRGYPGKGEAGGNVFSRV